jgi:hypothetical protein
MYTLKNKIASLSKQLNSQTQENPISLAYWSNIAVQSIYSILFDKNKDKRGCISTSFIKEEHE